MWRAADGDFYYAGLHSSGLGLWRSSDECQNFAFRSMIHTGAGDDQGRITVDNNPDSPYFGRLYVAWTDFAAGGHIYVTASDNGTAWSAPIDLSQHDIVNGAWPAVGPDGDVYVGWLHWDAYPAGPIDVEIVRSDDGGATWGVIANPMDNRTNPRDATASTSCGRPALNEDIRYNPYPQLAVGPDGCLHVVYTYDPDGYNAGDVVNVYYRRSCDDGATWRPEDRLNDDATTADQWSPTLSVGPDNVVVAAWYDRRLDPEDNLMFDYYSTRSLDGGVHWESNARVSRESSPVPTLSPNFDPIVATCYHGDSDQQVQDGTAVYLQWSDDRNEQNSHPDPDVWFERVWTERPLEAPSSLHVVVPYNETRTVGLDIDNGSPVSVGFEIVEVDRGYTTPTVRSTILSTGATLIDPCLVAITAISLGDASRITETTELETTLAEVWGTWVVVTSVQQAQDAGADVVIDRIAGLNMPPSDYNDWFDDGHGLVQIGDWPSWFLDTWEGQPTGTLLTITVADHDHALTFDLPPAWIGRGLWAHSLSTDYLGWVDDLSYPNIIQGRYTSLRGRVVSARDYAPGRAVYLGVNTYGSLASAADKTLLQNAVDWSGSCGRFGVVVWMDELPLAGTMPMSDTQVIDVTFDASLPEIAAPGEYYATLLIETDAAFDNLRIPVTMTVVLASPIYLPIIIR